MKCWIYIFEDGQIGASIKGPTSVDLQLISDGTLTVLHSASNIVQLNDDNRPELLPTCIIQNANGERWHELPEED